MKLLYITNGIKGAGGLERVLAVKASYLADVLGYEVHVLTLNHNNAPIFYDFSPKIQLHDVAVSGNPLQYVKSYFRGIRQVVHNVQPDVISVCDDGLKGFFIPLFIKVKGMLYERHVSKIIALGPNPSLVKKITSGISFFFMNHLAKNFDRFVVLTQDNLSEWKGKNVVVISNPLSFYPSESSSLQHKKVIAVGKQGFQKGYDRLLESWALVHRQHPDWTLSIYGTIDVSQGLLEQSQRLAIEKSVFFYEPVKDIQAKFLDSSVFVFSSRFEGFGMVLIEAMACGVPCVSFDCPCGPSDIITDGEDGFLVANGNIDEFAQRMLQLIENENLRTSMGCAAKENVKRYLPETIVAQWDALFKTLVK